MGGGILVIGLGNALRGDDRVGLWVAARVAAAHWPQVTGLPLEAADPMLLLETWAGYERVYVVDAVAGSLPAGTIVRVDLLRRRERQAVVTPATSHGLGLAHAVELGRALHALPRHLILYGIVGREFVYGGSLSPDVEAAARRVLARLRRACRAATGRAEACTNTR